MNIYGYTQTKADQQQATDRVRSARSGVVESAAELALYFPVCLSVLQCVAACCNVLQRGAVCCIVLQRGAECCSVLQRVAMQCVAACCNMLQQVEACGSVMQCVAVCCVQTALNLLLCWFRVCVRSAV